MSADTAGHPLELAANLAGFYSLSEMHALVSSVDLSTRRGLDDFARWKMEDGTKAGLLKLNFARPIYQPRPGS
jgi:hypothetical protein